MKIEYTPVRELRFYPNNARTHSKKQIRQIANSIAKFGFCNPVLVDDAKQIIAGHGRVEAAKLLDIDAVPTCRLSHLSDADKRAYILADNKLAEKAGWDKELLAIELQGLIEQHNSLPNGAGNFSGPSREFGLYPGLHPEGVNREMLVPTLAAQCGCSGIFFGGAPHRARTVSMLAETLPGRPPTAFLDDGWRRGGGSLPIRVSCACARDPGNCRRQAGPGPFPRAREGCTLG